MAVLGGDFVTPVSLVSLIGYNALFFVLYIVALSIYRLYFHPLAKFPGSRLAAWTYWYEFYYDVVQRGQYVFRIRDMHRKYGPIIRINPEEIHVADPEFFNEIYSQTEKRDVWGWQRKGFGTSASTLTTLEHEHHRKRRAAWNPVFAKQRIVRLQPAMEERLDALLKRIRECGEKGEVINLKYGFAAFSADVAMKYFFGKDQHKVEAPDFDPTFHDAVEAGFNNVIPMNQFPLLMDALMFFVAHTPAWILTRYFARRKMTTFVTALKLLAVQAHEVMARPTPVKEEAANHTVFDQILASKLPPEEKTYPRLMQDGQMLIVAASLSTAWSIAVTAYCLVANPQALAKLKAELRAAFPGGPDTITDLVTLEHLPYLGAVLQESLRIGIAISHRSARISPDVGLTYTDPRSGAKWFMPPGTPMSMSHGLLFRDASIFPNPTAFRPERWLENPGLEKYQFAFSKGTRGCPAVNLAMVEMILPTAKIFSRYGSKECRCEGDIGWLELFETDDSDVECSSDGGIAMVKEGSKGIRFRVFLSEKA